MKTVKFFTFALLAGAVMLGCEKDPQNGGNNPGDNTGNEPEEPVIEVPQLEAPAEGSAKIAIYTETMCDKGAVMKACFAPNAEVAFEAVPDYEGWYVAEVKLEADGGTYEGKACLLEEDGTVSGSWDTQWSKTDGDLELFEETTATAEFVDDFGSLNKLSISSTGVVYVKIAKWNSVPCVILPPAEEAWIKHASATPEENWVAEKMEKVADATFTHTFVYSDNGCNIGIDESCSGWFAPDAIVGLTKDMAGKTIKVTFVSTAGVKGTLSAELAE